MFGCVQVVGASPNLTISVTNETAGKYTCKASVVGFAEISTTATVFLKGPPTITSARRQYGITGVDTRVECKAFSVPKVKFNFFFEICIFSYYFLSQTTNNPIRARTHVSPFFLLIHLLTYSYLLTPGKACVMDIYGT